MKVPGSAQDWIHWIEVGGGAGWVRRAAVLLALLLLSVLAVYKQYHGPADEQTLLQADVGRQLAAGRGFTTLVNYPQTAAVMQRRQGRALDRAEPYPELHHAPLYSITIAAGLRCLPAPWREALFAAPGAPADAFKADFFLVALNVIFLWVAAWQSFLLARRLFDERVAWVAMFALLLSVGVWDRVLLVDGLPLLMMLSLGAFHLMAALDTPGEGEGTGESLTVGGLVLWGALGGVCGLLFLAEYSAGLLGAVAAAFAYWRLRGNDRWMAVAALTLGFAFPALPWMVRNVALTGDPVGLAAQNLALKAGDSTAEPAIQRTLFSSEAPALDLNKIGNKGLTGLQLNVKERLWSGGGYFLAAFFVVGWLYPFRRASTNRLRWACTAGWLLLILAQPFLGSGESPRLPVFYLLPLILIFGAGFFFVLVESTPTTRGHAGLATALLLALQASPLAHDLLQPR